MDEQELTMQIAGLPTSTATRFTRALLALAITFVTTAGLGQEPQRRQGPPPGQQQTQQAVPGRSVLRLLPADSVTEHAIDIPSGRH